jgi:dinuclear metal center YbgI/SA1388 family protein
VNLYDLVEYLDVYLQCAQFKDACPNGLQVSGKTQIRKIIIAVTAAQSVLDVAAQSSADAVLVHHGYFWKGETPCIVGVKRKRLATLLQHDMNLLAYHLPLDAHPVVGNNVQLSLQLGITKINRLENGLLYTGEFIEPLPGPLLQAAISQTLARPAQHIAQQFALKTAETASLTNNATPEINSDCYKGENRDSPPYLSPIGSIQRKPLHIAVINRPIQTIAWSTGAAQDSIVQAASLGVDAFLSGEISERTYYLAQELNIDYFACGHHATERYGILALGKHLAEKFSLDVEFVDTENPV